MKTPNEIEKFLWRYAMDEEYDFDRADLASQIATVLRIGRGVELSVVEAAMFWAWRSRQFDATWLISAPDHDVFEWFDKLVEQEKDDT